MSDKTDWASMDKRIRDRRVSWSKEDKSALDAGLAKLPDLAEKVDLVEIPQPAIGSAQGDSAEAEGGNASSAAASE
ncbi:MAG: hypothetical protein AAF928_21640 [Myxococcota bacterium]